ncbi:hypothetical protein ABVK25_011555 [Lepraria finkii]|uniref:Uncharacterized protein n=1 Tax=Lepraria finkii TaxID=1340010 RepID=A0ABR4AM10_9LECA
MRERGRPGGLRITPVLQSILVISNMPSTLLPFSSKLLDIQDPLYLNSHHLSLLLPIAMKLSAPFAAVTLLAPVALAASLPACSSTSTTPCGCPSDTSYEQSVTFAVIGAAATDVKTLISDFFKTAWLGIVPFATQGPDNQSGSTRTSSVPTATGNYTLTEKLTELGSNPSGSFIEKFEQLPSTVPVEYISGNGSFSGYWVTLESKFIFQYETAIVWSIYACSTGHPRDFASFHESALANATSVLQREGKVLGLNVKPFSIQAF